MHVIRKPPLVHKHKMVRVQPYNQGLVYNEHHHHYPEIPADSPGCAHFHMCTHPGMSGPKDSYAGPSALPSPPASPAAVAKPAMVDAGTQTGVDNRPASEQYKGTWWGFGLRCYETALPVCSWAGRVIVFCASRINFGLAYRVPWVPFIGLGSP